MPFSELQGKTDNNDEPALRDDRISLNRLEEKVVLFTTVAFHIPY